MEYLRWILLVIAVAVVALVYLRGRAKRKASDCSPLDAANDVPSFGARDETGDGWKDGVGPVRVVTREEVPVTPLPMDKFEPVAEAQDAPVDDSADEEVVPSGHDQLAAQVDDVAVDSPLSSAHVEKSEPVAQPSPVVEADTHIEEDTGQPDELQRDELQREESQGKIGADDVIVLYVVADRGEELKGEQILGATIATHLEYGDMDIFHRRDGQQKILFSMANMMEPGTFDYHQMHELKTRGVSLFIQLGLCDDPVEALDEMLVCAHTLATMLNARMCDSDRRLLNETMARTLREKARYYQQLKQQKPAHTDS
jgi:cell division protein ZipA